jgi:LuxR family transcriptional regulator, regulator of acetate metabolism
MEGSSEAISRYAGQASLGDLTSLQRRLNGAPTTGELLARACVEGAQACGFTRGVVLAVQDGRLTSSGTEKIDDPACDALRRQSLANPIPIEPGSEEAELIRRAGGSLHGSAAGSSVVAAALELDEYVIAPVVPESHAVALVVLDRADPPVLEADEPAVELFAHLVGVAIERVVLRLRMRELATELRYLTASAHALMNEAL